MPLTLSLREEITDFLLQRPNLTSERERKAFLYGAGLDQVVKTLDLHGAPQEFVAALIQQCDAYGTVDGVTPALVAVLRACVTLVGSDKQPAIADLCHKVMLAHTAAPADAAQSSRVKSDRMAAYRPSDPASLRRVVDREEFLFIVQKMQRDDPFVASQRDKNALMRIMYFYSTMVYDLDFYKMGQMSRFLFLRHKQLRRLMAIAVAVIVVITSALTLLGLKLLGKLAF